MMKQSWGASLYNRDKGIVCNKHALSREWQSGNRRHWFGFDSIQADNSLNHCKRNNAASN
jgi:hypothetical protein